MQFERINPLTGAEVIAERRRIKVDYELPMRDEYSQFVRSLLGGSLLE